jgi:hypothetical protein
VWLLMRALYPDVLPDTLAFALEFVELEPEHAMTDRRRRALAGARAASRRGRVARHSLHDRRRSVLLYSGDSPWDDRFLELARGVDLFLCECTAYEEPMGRHISGRRWRRSSRASPASASCSSTGARHAGALRRARRRVRDREPAHQLLNVSAAGVAADDGRAAQAARRTPPGRTSTEPSASCAPSPRPRSRRRRRFAAATR